MNFFLFSGFLLIKEGRFSSTLNLTHLVRSWNVNDFFRLCLIIRPTFGFLCPYLRWCAENEKRNRNEVYRMEKMRKTRETNRIFIIRNKRNIEIHANYAGSSRQIKKKESCRYKIGISFSSSVHFVIWPIKKKTRIGRVRKKNRGMGMKEST